jgi:hypothetical protein
MGFLPVNKIQNTVLTELGTNLFAELLKP